METPLNLIEISDDDGELEEGEVVDEEVEMETEEEEVVFVKEVKKDEVDRVLAVVDLAAAADVEEVPVGAEVGGEPVTEEGKKEEPKVKEPKVEGGERRQSDRPNFGR